MKNSVRLTAWFSSLTAVVLIPTSATTANTPMTAPKSAVAKVGLKKAPPTVIHAAGTTMNSAETVIPNKDTLPLAQGQQAAAFAEAGQKALEAGNLTGAELYFRTSTELNNSDPAALAGFAQTLEQEGKNREAIPVYRYLLYPKKNWGTSMEQDPILRMHFASLLAGDGQWAEAVSVYENTIGQVSLGSAYPSLQVHFTSDVPQPALFQAMTHLVMGVTYNGQLEHTKALAEYQAAISAQPDFALAQYCYGHGLQRLGKRVEAQAAFQKAAALGEGDVKKAAQSPDGVLP